MRSMTLTGLIALSLTFLAAAVDAQGQQTGTPVPPSPAAQSGEASQSPSHLSKTAYDNLFRVRSQVAAATRARTRGLTQTPLTNPPGPTEFRCTMRIIPIDPTIDPEIRVGPPSASATEHTMRIIEPPCSAIARR